MYAVEFESKVVDGKILIPKEYSSIASDTKLKVVVMSEQPLDEDVQLLQSQKLDAALQDYQDNALKNFHEIDKDFWDKRQKTINKHK
ncbi:MAG: hypothetical protein ACQESH_08645 [Campylobacterota bacterium]